MLTGRSIGLTFMHCSLRRFFATVARRTRKVAPDSAGDTGVVNADQYRLSVHAGSGGDGILRYNGTGGNGGSVFVVGKPKYEFHHIKKQLFNRHVVRANNGEPAKQTRLIGRSGENRTLVVPIGVEVVDTEKRVILARCTKPFERHLIAQGGQGGSASTSYRGMQGESLVVDLHLKLRPNVGLVGFPNAGKSTLLKALLPRKTIKIASYPFTTTKPQLCFLKEFDEKPDKDMEEQFSLSIADLPGLIEGASENRGKGVSFLKHLEYSDILLLIVDIGGFQLSASLKSPYRSPLDTVALLNVELERYDNSLVRKPAIVAVNKIDLPDGKMKAGELTALLRSKDWFKSVAEEIRPSYPLQFDAVIPICAKEARLSNLRTVLKDTFLSLHPLSDPADTDTDKDSSPRLV